MEKIENIANREEHNLNVDTEADEIKTLIDAMRDKNVQPKCKRLHRNTIETDFTTASKDAVTMNTAKAALENKIGWLPNTQNI